MDPNCDTAYDAVTSASFVEVDDKLGWTLGYPFALRALRVGGPDAPEILLDYGCGPGFVVLDPHADYVGVQFSTLRSGEPGVTYQDGDPRLARLLLTNGEWLELSDYFWSARTYHEVMAGVGFTDIRTEAPLLADAHGLVDPADLNAWDYDAERTQAPMILIHGCRPAG